MTVTADSLPELVGALTDAASLLQAGDHESGLAAELAPLVNGAAQAAMTAAALPLPQPPPPDYVAAGLTAQQAYLAQQQAAGAAMYVPPQDAPPIGAGIAPVAVPQPQPAQPLQQPPPNLPRPFCQLHQKEMVWKGGGLSPRGKNLPLWSCPQPYCKEAVWPPSA